MPSTVPAISLPRLPGAESRGFERGYGSVLLRLPCLFFGHIFAHPQLAVFVLFHKTRWVFFVFVVFFEKLCGTFAQFLCSTGGQNATNAGERVLFELNRKKKTHTHKLTHKMQHGMNVAERFLFDSFFFAATAGLLRKRKKKPSSVIATDRGRVCQHALVVVCVLIGKQPPHIRTAHSARKLNFSHYYKLSHTGRAVPVALGAGALHYNLK